MTVMQPYDQLALPLPKTAAPPSLHRVLAPARTALAAADRRALAAQLAGIAHLRGRTPVPKSGTAGPRELPRTVGRRLVPTFPELGEVAAFHAVVRLSSVDPTVNRFRVYGLSWQPTLWGDFALVQTWGRLGRPGRSRATSYPSRAAAQGMIERLLRRRLQHGYRVVTWT